MNYRLIDAHAHVNFNAFQEDSSEVIQRTLEQRVGVILVGSQIDTSRRAVEFTHMYPEGVYAAVGLHPIHLTEGYWDHNEIGAPKEMMVKDFRSRKEEFNYASYKELGEDSKVVAIGECGLDYFRVEDAAEVRPRLWGRTSAKEIQQNTFRGQIHLAKELHKPIMVHCRDAYDDCLGILREEKTDEIGGNIHFYVGDWETAKKFLDLGFYLSFTGVITFTHQYDEVIKNMPLDYLMVETDAPYVAPIPYRGKRNEPLYVEEVAKRIAEIRGITFEEVARATTQNAVRLFNIQNEGEVLE